MTMADRPIIFRAESVRAILDGGKDRTRRPVKPQPPDIVGLYWRDGWRMPPGEPADALKPRCPYGAPGDRLGVKEAWHPGFASDDEVGGDPTRTIYRATNHGPEPNRWRSPIHMPRGRSRLALRVLSVRVERVQDITEDEARREGMVLPPGFEELCLMSGGLRAVFEDVWNEMYARGPFAWERNPWVWALGFEREARP